MLTVDYDRLCLRRGDRVLDLGCGSGRHAFEAARRGGEVVALDAGTDELRDVRGMLLAMLAAGELDEHAHAGAVRADALDLPFADGAFDRVIAAEILEHITEDTRAIAELVRVLRPGGTMAVTVPRCGPEVVNWLLSDAYHDVPGGHVRIYRRQTLLRRLVSCGMVPVEHHYAHGLHSPYWWLRCLVGPANNAHPAVAAYHRLLVWEIVKQPRATRLAARVLDPLIGKSLVVYFNKPRGAVAPSRPRGPSHAEASAA
ncbi:MAG: class I SAM-dependent methyltransferase [Acidimicrobiales bacterium]